MSDIREHAKLVAEQPDTPSEAKIALLAMRAVIDHYEWRLLDLDVKYRKSEYNYASQMLTEANRKMKEHKDGS